MPKPEQICTNSCTVALGVCWGQLVVRHSHSTCPQLPSLGPSYPPSVEVTDPFVPAQLFAWLCPKLSCEMLKIFYKKQAEFNGELFKIQLSSRVWLTAGPCTAGLAYPGGMLTASPCEWEFLKLTLPAAKYHRTTASAYANLHLKIRVLTYLHLKIRALVFFYVKQLILGFFRTKPNLKF